MVAAHAHEQIRGKEHRHAPELCFGTEGSALFRTTKKNETMKQAPNQRRSRGRGNNSGGNNNGGGRRGSRNQSYESNGPEVKVRGSAQQVLDKYLQLARDCQTGGDRVKAEAYLQFAEHYYRIVNADQDGEQSRPDRQQQQQSSDRQRFDGDQTAPEQQQMSERIEQPQVQPQAQADNQRERSTDRPASDRPTGERPARGRGRGRNENVKNEATLAAEAAAANEAALMAGQPEAVAAKPARRPTRRAPVKAPKAEVVEPETDDKPKVEVVSA